MNELVNNLLDGQYVAARRGAALDVLNPVDGAVVGRVAAMTTADLPAVFDAAERGASLWRSTSALSRGRVLLTAAAAIRQESDDLVETIVSEMGKTRDEAAGEVEKAAEFFEYYGALARLPSGEVIPDSRPNTFVTQTREPLGVVLLITPWNDPMLTPARKLAPALVSGNAVVLKPASETPIIALKLAAILNRSGLPDGVLGTVTGHGAEIGSALTEDPRINAVSFTGSTSTGLEIQRRLAGRSVRVQTEMGGKNAVVVLDDADLDLAVPIIIGAAFGQAGQRCTATSRLIAQRGIANAVRERVAHAVTELTIGAGGEADVNMGPVVSVRAKNDVERSIATALAEGAELIATSPLSAQQKSVGAFVSPVFLGVETTNSVWREEVFGPVLAMTVVETLADAILQVNDSTYGLSSAIFTRSLDNAFAFIDGVDSGQVSVNQPTSGWDVHEPFGGFKESGSPFKEQGLEGLRFYTRVKTSAIRTR